MGDLMVYNNTYLCLITAVCCFANNSIGKNTSFLKNSTRNYYFFQMYLKQRNSKYCLAHGPPMLTCL